MTAAEYVKQHRDENERFDPSQLIMPPSAKVQLQLSKEILGLQSIPFLIRLKPKAKDLLVWGHQISKYKEFLNQTRG